MLKQNRYLKEDFYHESNQLRKQNDEVYISDKHNIVIGLEPHQIENYKDLIPFILNIINHIPMLDNWTQDYFEKISNDTDLAHTLEVIYFEGNTVHFDYWSEVTCNQFPVNFCYENEEWILKEWNQKPVPHDWKSLPNKSCKN